MNYLIKEKIYKNGAMFIMDIDNFKNINENMDILMVTKYCVQLLLKY